MALTLVQTSIKVTPRGLKRLKVLAALCGKSLGGFAEMLADAEFRARGLDRLDLTTADDPALGANGDAPKARRAGRRQAV